MPHFVSKTRREMVLYFNVDKGQLERGELERPPSPVSVRVSGFTRERKRLKGSPTRRQQLSCWEPHQQKILRMQMGNDQQGHAQQYQSPNMLMNYQQPQLVSSSFHANSLPFLDNATNTTNCTRHQDLSPADYPNETLMQAYYMNQVQLQQLQKARDAERLLLNASYYRNCETRLQNIATERLLDQSNFLLFSSSPSTVPARAVPGSRHLLPPQQPPTTTNCVRNGAAAADMRTRTAVERIPIQHRPTAAEDYTRPRHYLRRSVKLLHVEDSDDSWLSPFLCFLRKDCLELFEAEQCDVFERRTSKQVVLHQIGVRCRFCAHLEHNDRIQRSSMFPSKVDGIYTSLPVLIRNHLSLCPEMPTDLRSKYTALKGSSKRDGLETRSYWRESAQALGIVDRKNGMFFKWRQQE